MTPSESLGATENPCSVSQLYRRVKSMRDSMTESAKNETARFLLRDATEIIAAVSTSSSNSSDLSTLTPSPRRRSRKKRKTGRAMASIEEGVVEGVESVASSAASSIASANLRRSTRPKPRATQHQANYNASVKKATKEDKDLLVKTALKEGTIAYTSRAKTSYRKIAAEMNMKHGLTGKAKLTKTILHKYVKDGMIGVSPMKRGPQRILPSSFWDLLNSHVSMTQLEGVGETKPRVMKALIGAALMGTQFENMSTESIYKHFRERYPDTCAPTRAMEMEERRMLWTTYPNVNRWFDGTKECLIHYGYVEDKPQLVIDIFKGRTPPCDIDREYLCLLFCFHIHLSHQIMIFFVLSLSYINFRSNI